MPDGERPNRAGSASERRAGVPAQDVESVTARHVSTRSPALQTTRTGDRPASGPERGGAPEPLSRRLAEIARDVQAQPGLGAATDEIVDAARDLLGAPLGVGVTFVRRRGELTTAAATSSLVEQGDALQYKLQEGPCVDAAWREDQVYAGDLGSDPRWPTWGPRVAAELGVHSMLCTQLFTNDDQLGALNVYAAEPYAFDAEARETAALLAAHAAIAVAAAREIETLRVAVDRRTTIGKALGILMARYDVDDDQAMAVLRRLSSQQQRKLYDIAVEVVHLHRLPSAAAAAARDKAPQLG